MTISNGLLTAQPYKAARSGPALVMLAMDDRRFYGRGDEETEIVLDTDSTGKVNGVKIIQRGMTRYARKIK